MEEKNLLIGIIFLIAITGIMGLIIVHSQEDPQPEPEPSQTNVNATVVAESLEVPWSIEFTSRGDMLVTERTGKLLKVNQENSTYTEIQNVEGVEHRGEGGLLGMALHPDFSQNRFIYLYMTTEMNQGMLENRVVRYQLENNSLSNSEVIIDGLPGAPYHDGGRIAFGPDEKLYITAGDATNPGWAQDTERYAGKILRVNPDGSIPEDNPFDNAVHSYGHRNPQGLTWIRDQLWATEHGSTGRDEINRIERGENYGWPEIEGDETQQGMQTPELHSGRDTWAPAGAIHVNGSIFFAGLRGNALYEAEIEDESVVNLEKHLTDYGRLRAVEMGPQGNLYVSTSNTDGRGTPEENDDKVLKVNPEKLN